MKRVQRKRSPGYRLPPHTLCVTRGTKYGNRWRVKPDRGGYTVTDGERRFWFAEKHQANSFAVLAFQGELKPELVDRFIAECKEKGIENIACYCPSDLPCHSDVWIDIWEAQK